MVLPSLLGFFCETSSSSHFKEISTEAAFRIHNISRFFIQNKEIINIHAVRIISIRRFPTRSEAINVSCDEKHSENKLFNKCTKIHGITEEQTCIVTARIRPELK